MMPKCILTALAAFSLGASPTLSTAQTNWFTVTDSIQMVHFNDPDGRAFNPAEWNISPDGSMALLVTTKGIVASNMVQSTLWTLDLRATAKYLEEKNGRIPPSPKDIFTARGQLRAFQENSYGSLITKSQWSLDSKAIYILLEQTGGRRELDKVSLLTGHKECLSQDGYSVSKYEIDSQGVMYSADELKEGAGLFRASTVDVVDTVRGTALAKLMWPSEKPKDFLFRSDSSGIRRIAPAPNPTEQSLFSIYPDGSKVIALVPVEVTPITWKRYLPSIPIEPLYRPASSTSRVFEYEVLDLRTNSRRALLDSPSGVNVGYYDRPHVLWSQDGKHALVTNTFLPFERQTQKEQEARRKPCAAAYVDMGNGSATCIVFERSSKHEPGDSWAISNIRFGRTDHDVVVNLDWLGHSKTECYSLTAGLWSEDSKNVCDASTETSDGTNRALVRLELIQGLNEPPSLWAEDVKTSRRAQIWNPNPQIAGKPSGSASVYHWLDKDQREWTGGLILPQGANPGVQLPLVIQTHGFNPKEFLVDGAWTTANAARPLAAAGFVVLQIEDKYEQTFTLEEAKIHINGYAAAIDQLAKSGLIDPKRVGIIGFSRTCWYVEESLLESPDRFAAAVLADGVDQSYLQYMLHAPEQPAMEAERYSGTKPIGLGLEAWIKFAPGFRLSELKTPLRLQSIAPWGLVNEWETYAALKLQNKPVDMVYLPLGQHVLQNPAERIASEQGDVDWFRFWLKGEKDHDPAKRDQYDRWESMQTEYLQRSFQ
jgi:dipeptidyl aminopeptidase/acylaminoacyl peptidase